LAKIAAASGRNPPATRELKSGEGWAITRVVCTAGRGDRPFEERHSTTSIAVVLEGTFDYRSSAGHEMMTPGSLLLGNAGDYFTCGHEHAAGDRCVSFSYTPEFLERLAHDTGVSGAKFRVPRLPPLRALAPAVTRAALLGTGLETDAEELSIEVAGLALRAAVRERRRGRLAAPGSLARVSRVVGMMEAHPDASYSLSAVAAIAGLSPYHFLRTFLEVAGVTPHQYLMRARLRRAALRLSSGKGKIVDIALDCGFGDVSNFNRAFRAEFGMSPRAYRGRNSG
jgi:AraC family transcriptional regulator